MATTRTRYSRVQSFITARVSSISNILETLITPGLELLQTRIPIYGLIVVYPALSYVNFAYRGKLAASDFESKTLLSMALLYCVDLFLTLKLSACAFQLSDKLVAQYRLMSQRAWEKRSLEQFCQCNIPLDRPMPKHELAKENHALKAMFSDAVTTLETLNKCTHLSQLQFYEYKQKFVVLWKDSLIHSENEVQARLEILAIRKRTWLAEEAHRAYLVERCILEYELEQLHTAADELELVVAGPQ
ncbi:hypothetical protein BDW22DRAFT_1427875 [Trametopsis cervina]|nr:hypothetical protein BDW22DRAFT_1427875 [Trametopsis cervina]